MLDDVERLSPEAKPTTAETRGTVRATQVQSGREPGETRTTAAQAGRVVTEGETAAHALVVRVLHLLAHVPHATQAAATPAHVAVHRWVQVRGAERVEGLRI